MVEADLQPEDEDSEACCPRKETMRTCGRAAAGEVFERLRDALNRHDLDGFVDCFDCGYRSEQPVHPDRAFTGREQVRRNWAAVFDGVPDFRAELLRSAQAGDARWAEWYWHGTRADGTRLEMRGVTIFGVQHDRIVCGSALHGGRGPRGRKHRSGCPAHDHGR